MAGELTITAANGLLKPVFGDELLKVLPEAALLQKRYPLASDIPLVGKHYEVPVAVRMPQGHSFNGTAGAVVALNSPLAGKTEPAQVTPYEYVLREHISYGLLDSAQGGGQAAFMSAMKFDGLMMALAGRNILELQALHGQEGLGVANANITADTSATPDKGTVTISAASLAPGILAILEGALVDFYASDLSTPRATGMSVTAVDVDAGTVTIQAPSTGQKETDLAAIVATDVMFLAGANSSGTFNEQIGLGKQLAATTGTYFNIAKATYSAWRASIISNVGEFTVSSLVGAAVKVMNRGFASGELIAIAPPKAWGVIDSALATNETFPTGYSASRKTGTDEIEVRANGIKISIMPHPFQKQGQVYIVPANGVKRVGSVDFTFAKAGSKEEYLQAVQGYSAMERQCRASWQMFVERPAHAAIMTGITYS